ncbi:cadherin-like beta sandwich domain-containing protein [Paenibacillus agilis]|uniref:S-layer homology domain-containing protein n=1 Tax=Paenibacillus agilis TaxID=3020863 RepID=A0A559ID65_9BACL|nr:cadherin-like beta sandwich domain-containing protein [Paenibacillus agilis]TVX85609.1 hypothetical protein FPZ44_24970 [Paenibacillus agilis]
MKRISHYILFILFISFGLYSVPAAAAAPDNASLSSLTIEGIKLDQPFHESTTQYSAKVNSELQQTTVTATARDTGATITVNGMKINSGNPSQEIQLAADSITSITVLVKADGAEKSYTINVTRNPVPSVLSASIKSTGETAAIVTWSIPAGVTDLETVFVSQDGNTLGQVKASDGEFRITGLSPGRQYQFSIVGYNKIGKSGSPVILSHTSSGQSVGDVKLTTLRLDIPLHETFSPARLSYTATAAYTKDKITIYPVGVSGSKIKINNTEISGQMTLPLIVGLNEFKVEVIGSNTQQSTHYIVKVTRLNQSTKSDLISLSLLDVKLNEAFMSGRTSYTAHVPFERADAAIVTTADTSTVIKINGSPIASGTAHNTTLVVGDNHFNITVTDPEGRINSYNLKITRGTPSSSSPLRSLFVEDVKFTEWFDPARTNYTATVPFEKETAKVFAFVNAPAYVVIGNSYAQAGNFVNVSLQEGSNVIKVALHDGYGKQTTYTIHLIRLGSTGTNTNNGKTTESKLVGSVVLKGDTLELDIREKSGTTPYKVNLEDIKKVYSDKSKKLVIKVGEANDSQHAITLDNNTLGFLKDKKLALRLEVGKISANLKSNELPVDVLTLSLKRLSSMGSQLPKGSIPAMVDYQVSTGNHKSLHVDIELNLDLTLENTKRAVVYQNEKLARTSAHNNLKYVSVYGDTILSAGMIERRFNDILGHWANEDIQLMAARQLIGGYEDGAFRPDQQITRAEFIQVLVTALELKGDKSMQYADVQEDAWYYDSVNRASAAGIVKGDKKNQFRPNEKITREEIAAIFGRLIENTENFSYTNTLNIHSFKDVNQVSPWAKDAFNIAIQARIISGTSEKLLSPKASGTRAQAVVMVRRFIEFTQGL